MVAPPRAMRPGLLTATCQTFDHIRPKTTDMGDGPLSYPGLPGHNGRNDLSNHASRD